MTHDHAVYEYMGAECSKLRQPMRAIFALSRAQLIFLVVTRSRELSRECHVTKHKTPARSNFPLSNFENSGTIQFSSSSSTSRGLCPKNFEKRAHPRSAYKEGLDSTRSAYKEGLDSTRSAYKEGLDSTRSAYKEGLDSTRSAYKEGLDSTRSAYKEGLDSTRSAYKEGLYSTR